MPPSSDRSKNGFPLSLPGDPLGVSCDANGPSIGPIRLLTKGPAGFVPRSAEDLDTITGAAFGTPLDYAMVLPGLLAVARALEAGDMTRAIFATQFMRLPALTEAQAQRAAEAMRKAAPGDKDHPGYPAHEPGGKGGQFRPKDEASSDDGAPLRVGAADHAPNQDSSAGAAKPKSGKDPAVRRAFGTVARRVAQVLIEKVFSPSRIGRFLAEAASNLVPGLDIVGDAMFVRDVTDIAGAVEKAVSEGEAAAEFAESAPPLTSVRVSETSEQFASYWRFRKDDLPDVLVRQVTVTNIITSSSKTRPMLRSIRRSKSIRRIISSAFQRQSIQRYQQNIIAIYSMKALVSECSFGRNLLTINISSG